jgi:ribosome recycling factor
MLEDIKKDTTTRMTKSVEALRQDLVHLRTGRASAAILEPIQVPYYGSDVPLSQVANIAVADARSLTITPFEKSMVGAIEKAIIGSNLGLTPTTVGQVIRLNIPALTEQRRKELAKHVAGQGEDAKVAIRNIRRDAIHQLKELLKDKKIGEDEERRGEEDVQKLTDRFVKDVDAVCKAKEDELMAM